MPAVVCISLTQNTLRAENLNMNQCLVMETAQFGGKGECSRLLLITETFKKCEIFSKCVRT